MYNTFLDTSPLASVEVIQLWHVSGVGVGLLGGHAIEVYTHAYFPNGELLEGVTVPYTPVQQHLVPIAIFPHYSPPQPQKQV